ncbi:MAG TPA: anthranilate phosphoribosyltransferase [Allosphingosinicella sp.]|nr:anthranilate phosphoribosyltransferase [Allosphingosinicella sp.]
MYLNQAFAADRRDFETETATVERSLQRLYEGDSLSADQSERLFTALVRGRLSEPTIAAMLIALRLNGETAEVLIGAARALRCADADFPRPDYLFADTCGTGGDGSGSINVSTAVAFVAAAAGLPIVKHGNRSFSSRCGSADVLERLGARLDVDAEQSRKVLDETGICFLFAPAYHPGLAHAGPVRRALKVRTIMNVLGPCLNPAEPPVQLLGVARPELLRPVAATLAALGVETALVVHGSGLDEVALHGPTEAIRLSQGRIESVTLTPEQAGFATAPLAGVEGGDADENAARLAALLRGDGGEAERRIVALNAGALLMTAGLAGDFREGVEMAQGVISSGDGHRLLEQFVAATHG